MFGVIRIVLLICLACFFVNQGCCNGVEGSGQRSFVMRKPGHFTTIEMTGSGNLIVGEVGDEELKIVGDENLIPLVSTDVHDETLVIKIKEEVTFSKRLIVYVGYKKLSGLKIGGVVDASNKGPLNADHFTLSVSGASKASLTRFFADSVDIKISGSGDALLKGEVSTQNITVSGAGNYNGLGLLNKSTNIRVSGAGYAQIATGDALDATVSDAGIVRYRGAPVIIKELTQNGRLEKL